MTDKIKKELAVMKTLHDFLSVFRNNYDTENCKVGYIAKATIFRQVEKHIKVADDVKKKILDVKTLENFIRAIQNSYPTDTIQLTPDAKHKLIDSVPLLVTITRVQLKKI